MFLHGNYAVGFVVNNESLTTSNVHYLNFNTNSFIMTNNTSHYMVSNKINRLIVVHLVKGQCGGVAIMRFPCNNMFFHICQMHLKNRLLFSYMLFTFNTGTTTKSYNHLWGTKFTHIKTKYLQINQIVWKIHQIY